MKASNMVFSVMADEDEQWTVTGMVQVIDCAGLSSSHALQMTPAFVKKAMVVWQVRIIY